MKYAYGITGGFMVWLTLQFSFFDAGLTMAILFLGASLCVSTLFIMVLPLMERLIGESCRDHYIRFYEEQMRRQEERMKQFEQEIFSKNRRSTSNSQSIESSSSA